MTDTDMIGCADITEMTRVIGRLDTLNDRLLDLTAAVLAKDHTVGKALAAKVWLARDDKDKDVYLFENEPVYDNDFKNGFETWHDGDDVGYAVREWNKHVPNRRGCWRVMLTMDIDDEE